MHFLRQTDFPARKKRNKLQIEGHAPVGLNPHVTNEFSMGALGQTVHFILLTGSTFALFL